MVRKWRRIFLRRVGGPLSCRLRITTGGSSRVGSISFRRCLRKWVSLNPGSRLQVIVQTCRCGKWRSRKSDRRTNRLPQQLSAQPDPLGRWGWKVMQVHPHSPFRFSGHRPAAVKGPLSCRLRMTTGGSSLASRGSVSYQLLRQQLIHIVDGRVLGEIARVVHPDPLHRPRCRVSTPPTTLRTISIRRHLVGAGDYHHGWLRS